MNKISRQLKKIKENISEKCVLVAVSKTKPNSAIIKAYETGHLHFGENIVQELVQKAEELPKEIKWHYIGHLQRNKVKYIAPFVHLIHGVDSLKLLQEINKQGEKAGRMINCLLQLRIAKEDTKFGLDKEKIFDIISESNLKKMNYIQIVGLMGMATNTENQNQIRNEFRELKSFFETIKKSDHTNIELSILSMGMSNDFHIALEEGSNMVRIGRAIFESKNS